MKYTKVVTMGVLVGLLIFVAYLGIAKPSLQEAGSSGQLTKELTIISSSASTNVTSSEIGAKGAKRVTLFLDNASPSTTAVTTFSVDVSSDGTNFVDYNKLVTNVANTNAQAVTRASSVTITATGTSIVSLDLGYDYIKSFKVNKAYTIGTNGTSTASVKAIIEY